ncbi:MAG: hypothetical protein J0H85_05835 [Sediminibacterium magnilacihabitans]|jgi:hypothetical protein|nr:hypothetical protein [Sediminibacterium magnilacihabitans]PQV61310.1 hypothetical protein CLV53_103162 [Sediminibacterium magnilacihabitans]
MSVPYTLWMLRFFGPVILMVLWIFYQLFIRKRPFKSLTNDALAAFFFVAVWITLSYFGLHS